MATDRLLYYGNLMVASTVSACPSSRWPRTAV